jgi:NADP-dependent 3-hydroxy acid dehydrogenase YdfG
LSRSDDKRPGALEGTVAVVTGASEGIGRSITRTLALEGATVLAVARRSERLETLASAVAEAGGTAHALVADLSQGHAPGEVIDHVVAAHGRLDILVNNAGLMLIGDALTADPDDWGLMIDVNLLALMRMSRAALPHLARAARSAPRYVADIVNIGSLSGRVPTPARSGYAASKGGVSAFSEALRQDLLSAKVRVGLIEPGLTRTGLRSKNSNSALETMMQSSAELSGVEPLDPDRVADAVRFVVCQPSDAALSDLILRPVAQP